jgi:hypothetical protein
MLPLTFKCIYTLRSCAAKTDVCCIRHVGEWSVGISNPRASKVWDYRFSSRCNFGIRTAGAPRGVTKSWIPMLRYSIVVLVSRVWMCNGLGHFDPSRSNYCPLFMSQTVPACFTDSAAYSCELSLPLLKLEAQASRNNRFRYAFSSSHVWIAWFPPPTIFA